jgi:hypothetical protein
VVLEVKIGETKSGYTDLETQLSKRYHAASLDCMNGNVEKKNVTSLGSYFSFVIHHTTSGQLECISEATD